MMLKLLVVCGLAAGIGVSAAAPAAAQEMLVIRALTDVCLPYAGRARSFEKALEAARDLQFRRPIGDTAPIEDWASEVDLVSNDGIWRLRIEEGSREENGAEVYAVTCSLSSRRASARELAQLAQRAFGNPERWTMTSEARWDRRTRRPEQQRMVVEVAERPDDRPAMTITGFYY
ncbi:MAG TPA: hypothetical protein VFF48_02310 [Brevundimonas sp.]|nr:hypothetical protein [Brevundimonas sp.]